MTILKNTHSSIINPVVMKMSLVYELQTLFSLLLLYNWAIN